MGKDSESSPSHAARTINPHLCLYSCHSVGKAGGTGALPRQWATFTQVLVNVSPMSRLLKTIKTIWANTNADGQTEAQRGAGTQHEAKTQSDSQFSAFSPASLTQLRQGPSRLVPSITGPVQG